MILLFVYDVRVKGSRFSECRCHLQVSSSWQSHVTQPIRVLSILPSTRLVYCVTCRPSRQSSYQPKGRSRHYVGHVYSTGDSISSTIIARSRCAEHHILHCQYRHNISQASSRTRPSSCCVLSTMAIQCDCQGRCLSFCRASPAQIWYEQTLEVYTL